MNISKPEVTLKTAVVCEAAAIFALIFATEELCAWSAWCNVTRDQLAAGASDSVLYMEPRQPPTHGVSTTSSCSRCSHHG